MTPFERSPDSFTKTWNETDLCSVWYYHYYPSPCRLYCNIKCGRKRTVQRLTQRAGFGKYYVRFLTRLICLAHHHHTLNPTTNCLPSRWIFIHELDCKSALTMLRNMSSQDLMPSFVHRKRMPLLDWRALGWMILRTWDWSQTCLNDLVLCLQQYCGWMVLWTVISVWLTMYAFSSHASAGMLMSIYGCTHYQKKCSGYAYFTIQCKHTDRKLCHDHWGRADHSIPLENTVLKSRKQVCAQILHIQGNHILETQQLHYW